MVSVASRAVTIGQWSALLVVAITIAGVWKWSASNSEQTEISTSDILSDAVQEAAPAKADVVVSESSLAPVVNKVPATGRTSDGIFFVEHGATLILDKESLLESEPLSIEFHLDVPWVDDVNQRPLLMSPDNKHTRLEGRPQAGDKQRIRVEIPPDVLSVGRHILQLKTNERNHMPIRRYALEVRASNSE